MTEYTNPDQHYQKLRFETASQHRLVLMAYDGIVGCLETAQKGLEKQPREIESVTNNLIKAQEILEVLYDGLDFDAGEAPRLLGSFYEFLRKHLVQANLHKTIPEVTKALDLVQEVRGFWLQAETTEEKPQRRSNSTPSPSSSAEAASFDSRR